MLARALERCWPSRGANCGVSFLASVVNGVWENDFAGFVGGMINVVRLAAPHRLAHRMLLERPICLTNNLKCPIACGCTVERVSLCTFVRYWIRIEESILAFCCRCGMFNRWRWSAWLGETVMSEVLSGICSFKVAFRAMTLVIVHQVFTATWKTSTLGTIGHIAANLETFLFLLLEATVALAMVVIEVPTCGLLMVDAPSIRPTLVALAVILVCTAIVVALLSISHANGHEICAATRTTANGVARIAIEERRILEHELRRWAKMLTIWRHDHCTALHRLASRWSIVLSRSLARLRKFLRAVCSSID